MTDFATDALVLDDSLKGYPKGAPPTPADEVGKFGWNVLREDLPMPVALLHRSAMENNSRWMRRFLELSGAAICPHGKTTMSPQLFRKQLDDGAWGITVSTVNQLRVCRAFGIDRVLLANQIVDGAAIAYLMAELKGNPDFDFYCLVDSVSGVARLAEAARAHDLGRPLQVLLEGGVADGRTGCRDLADSIAVAEAVLDARPALALRGVEGYEGLIQGATPAERDGKVAAFLDYLARILETGLERDWFAPGPIILTAGGSAFYDMVTERFGRLAAGREIEVLLRSGCYLTHDSKLYQGIFADLRERSATARAVEGEMRPALEIWAAVQSIPEPGLAIATLGKRDVSFDVDLPLPQVWCRPGPGARPSPLGAGHEVKDLNDQHAYMRLPPDSPLRVGDLVGFGISHPCTTFDRWQLLYLIDDDYQVTGAIRTFF